MRIVRTDDPVAFLDLAGPLLRRDEARNHLILGVAATHAADSAAYEYHRGWIALDPEAIAADAPGLPGLTANLPAVQLFVNCWTGLTGRRARTISRLTDYALEQVREVRRAPGSPRPADRRDRDLVVRWMRDFSAEAPPQDEIVGA